MTNKVNTIKLLGGDEVVAEIVDSQPGYIVVRRPVLVVMGQQGFGFMPFMLTAGMDITVELERSAIVSMAPTLIDVVKAYTTHTVKQTTGLVV